MKIYIGTSGWQYYHWKEKFYPSNLKSSDFLSFYSKNFNTVEINTSFYHFTKKETFTKWQKLVPKNFIFAVKLHRLFTHLRKLNLKKDDEELLKNFLENASALKNNLGPILIQLPPSFKNKETLEKFIKKFKNITEKVFKKLPKIAIEFRNKNLLNKDIYRILKKEKIIFVISDSPRWQTDIVKTTDEVYVRFHGKPKLFASKYSKEELKRYATLIKSLKPKILYAYFNNDFEGYAVENAREFLKILSNN
jgi:uncharacterized protein YecE (DUF72 family)